VASCVSIHTKSFMGVNGAFEKSFKTVKIFVQLVVNMGHRVIVFIRGLYV